VSHRLPRLLCRAIFRGGRAAHRAQHGRATCAVSELLGRFKGRRLDDRHVGIMIGVFEIVSKEGTLAAVDESCPVKALFMGRGFSPRVERFCPALPAHPVRECALVT